MLRNVAKKFFWGVACFFAGSVLLFYIMGIVPIFYFNQYFHYVKYVYIVSLVILAVNPLHGNLAEQFFFN
ncbi:MAG: hypothetical protein EA414_05340 [Arthrospira sp. PLM2.Bin9]|nr:MAG: hypothetical protein EA414_05340 [Arthrospira sp. PLM2.Bin9]